MHPPASSIAEALYLTTQRIKFPELGDRDFTFCPSAQRVLYVGQEASIAGPGNEKCQANNTAQCENACKNLLAVQRETSIDDETTLHRRVCENDPVEQVRKK
jgi:hypothetical protein